ncbi:MAG: alcohol dehydrogenase catalytic domain-containing protein, partial [Erysipelotrichaceae bacterium]|nr:alcohol dehydrogenase catalytic domain-containing protein [Erysipelotrichaceae bacterium]
MNDNLMWALVKEKAEEGIWMKRVPIPEVGYNDVKIKIRKTAICGTDVHIYSWNRWAQKTIPIGLTIGHEYVGKIVEVGKGVEGFKPGEIVSGEGHITRGKC